jgi:hypothetical protein
MRERSLTVAAPIEEANAPSRSRLRWERSRQITCLRRRLGRDDPDHGVGPEEIVQPFEWVGAWAWSPTEQSVRQAYGEDEPQHIVIG